MEETTELKPEHYGLLANDRPYKCYIKRILGQVYVNVLDPFDETRIKGLILKGDPKSKNRKTCIVKIWDEKQDRFFKEINERHFSAGRLIEIPVEDIVKIEQTKERSYADYSDDELLELLKTPFAKLAKIVADIPHVAVVASLLQLATEQDKSKRTVDLLKSRLSELQQISYSPNTVTEL